MPIGSVILVGAGPGTADLITMRGLGRLRAAEVVVYDRLIDPRLLREAPAGVELIFAGKASGSAVIDQATIERVLIERARAGKRVVRLKGGDPFVFGRGGEEIEALTAAGIPWEVVPGVTSAIAAPGAVGIPVTHREYSSMVTIVTGHEDPTKIDAGVDWEWLGRSQSTLVVLMGLERLESVCQRLIAGGRDPSTPVAAVAAATRPDQQSLTATLSTIAAGVTEAGLRSPATVIIGDVARFPAVLASLAPAALAEAG